MKQKAEQQTLQGMEMYKCSFAVYLLVFVVVFFHLRVFVRKS